MSVATVMKFSNTDTPRLRSYCVPEDPAAVQFCGSRNWVHMWSTTVKVLGGQLKSKFQHTGT